MTVRRYPKKVRDEIIARVKAGDKVADLASQYGMSDRIIYTWLRSDSGDEAPSISLYNKLKKENQRLKWLVGELTLEVTRGKKD